MGLYEANGGLIVVTACDSRPSSLWCSPVPVAGICFLPLRAVAGVLRAAAVAAPTLLPLCAGDRGAGAEAALTGVRGTGLPFGACMAAVE